MTVVEDIKARVDIVDLIGSYVPLQKAGRTFKAPCPFHSERTPSFTVNPDRQTWHCFGACSTGGDIFAFVSKKEDLDFAGALRFLADRAGIELHADGPRRQEIKTLYDLNEAAALYFHSLLLRDGGAGRAYTEERGLDRETIRDFQMGLSAPSWDALREHLRSRGFADAMQVEAGLVIASDRGGYDRFRGRLMVPIRDDRGRVAGFGGRVIPGLDAPGGGDEGAKYINTPLTPIFDKGSIFFALDKAKDEIRNKGTAVIVEGYMDVIATHQFGFRNVIASMGTALTDRQAALVQRFASRIVLAMDADAAGNTATLRGIQVVAAAARRAAANRTAIAAGGRARTSLDLRVAALPAGIDPDNMVRQDPDSWVDLIAGASQVVDHLYQVETAGKDLRDPRERAAVVEAMLPLVAELDSPTEQAHWVDRLSFGSRATIEAISRQVNALRRRAAPSNGPRRVEPAPAEAPRANARVLPEEYGLALLYLREDIAGLGRDIDEDLFTLSENRELYRRWKAGETILEDELVLWEQLQKVLITRLPEFETNQAEAAFLDCIGRLRQAKIRVVKEASSLALAEGEARVRPGQVASIARARLEAGQEEETEDGAEQALASQFLEDKNLGLLFHRRPIDSTSFDQAGKPPRTGGQ